MTRSYPAGRSLQIFVGRQGGALGGRTARLTVTHTPRPVKRKCKKKKKRSAAAAGCKKKKKKEKR